MDTQFIGLQFDFNSGFCRHHKHENLLSLHNFRGLYNILSMWVKILNSLLGYAFFHTSNILTSFIPLILTVILLVSDFCVTHSLLFKCQRIFIVCKLVRNVYVEILDLQVIVNVGHIGAVLKGLPVRGFCFVILALRTQDVSQVPVRCSAKQNKLDICRCVSRMSTGGSSTQPERKASKWQCVQFVQDNGNTGTSTLRIYYLNLLQGNLIYNTKKCTSIKIDNFTYNPLTLRHVSIFLAQRQGILHQTGTHKTRMN